MATYICKTITFWNGNLWKPGSAYDGSAKPPECFELIEDDKDLEVEVAKITVGKALTSMKSDELLIKASELKMIVPNGLSRPKLLKMVNARLKMDEADKEEVIEEPEDDNES